MQYPSPPQLIPIRYRASAFPEVAREATPTEHQRNSRGRREENATGRKPKMAVGNRDQMKKYLADSYTRHEEISILPGQRNDYRIYGKPSIKLYDSIIQGQTSSNKNFPHIDGKLQRERSNNMMALQMQSQPTPVESNERKAHLARRAAQEHYKAELDLQIAQQNMLKQQEKAKERKVHLPGPKPKHTGPIPTYDSENEDKQIVPHGRQTGAPYLPAWFKPILPADPLHPSPSPDERGSPQSTFPHYEIQSQDQNGISISPSNGQMQLISTSQLQDVPRTQSIPVPVPENSVLLIQRFPQSSPTLQLSPSRSEVIKPTMESLILSVSPKEMPSNESIWKQHVSQTADQRPGTIVKKRTYDRELQLQIEDRKRREVERKRAEQLEEEMHELRIKEDQERMEREYKEEKLRQKKKEEEALKWQEEILKQDTIRKKEAEEEKRQRMEKKRRPLLGSGDSNKEQYDPINSNLPNANETSDLTPTSPVVIRSTNSPPIVSQYSLYLANHSVEPDTKENGSNSQQSRQITSQPIVTKYSVQNQTSKVGEGELSCSNSSTNLYNEFNISDSNTSEKEEVLQHESPRRRRVRKRAAKSKTHSTLNLESTNNDQILQQWKQSLEMELVRSKLEIQKMMDSTDSLSESEYN